MRRNHGCGQVAGLLEVAVDAFICRHARHFGQRFDHHLLQAKRAFTSLRVCNHVLNPGQVGTGPAAVATRGAEAGDIGLEHNDFEHGCMALEVVSGPQASETCPDDDHVRC